MVVFFMGKPPEENKEVETPQKVNVGGRPRADIDMKVLETLCQFKVTKKFCAEYLEVSEDAIEARIRRDFDKTFEEYRESKNKRMQLKLQSTAIEMALGKNVTMLIFCLKNLSGWTDKPAEIDELKSSFKNIEEVLDDIQKKRGKNDHRI